MWLLGCKGALVRLLDGWALRPDKDWMGRIVTSSPFVSAQRVLTDREFKHR